MSERRDDDHWLVRPATIRRLWIIFIALLALLVLAQIPIPIRGYFNIDRLFGFGALFGFLSCVAMVVFARLLGLWLKRPEDYYDE